MIKLDPETERQISLLAEQSGLSFEAFATAAMIEKIEEAQDAALLDEAMRASSAATQSRSSR